MIQIFTLTLAANEVREVSASGEYFELRNALFPIALIELLDRNGAILARLENPEQSDFVRTGPFGTVRITNGANAQTVKHFYGTGDAGSRRTSGVVTIAGQVNVANERSSATLAGNAYIGRGIGLQNTGTYPQVQCFNAVGSGKNVLVRKGVFWSNVASTVGIRRNGVPLVTTFGQAANKNILLPDSAAVSQRSDNVLVISGSTYALRLQPNVNYVWEIDEPLLIPPGIGFLAANEVLGSDLQMHLDLVEVPI